MKRYLFLIALLIAWSGRVVAQSVTVDATIDSLQILIGEQAKIKLQVSLDADKRAIFPVYTDTLVNCDRSDQDHGDPARRAGSP